MREKERVQSVADSHCSRSCWDPLVTLSHTLSLRVMRDIVAFEEKGGRAVVTSAIDNICRGAAGQAVQNMNAAFGLDEGLGLA